MRAISLLLVVISSIMVAGPSALGQAAKPGTTTTTAHAKTPPPKTHATVKSTKTSKPVKTPAKTSAPPQPVLTAAAPAPPPGAVAPIAGTALRDAPDGKSVATLTTLSTLEPIAHDHGWVRVRAEGWVKDGDVAPMDPSMVTLSAADIRADPDAAKGKIVRWNVEVLAIQTADVLRKGLNPEEPYLLARGPGNESALIYVAVPPALLVSARSVASSAPVPVTLVATVRVGRSDPVGVPILDAQSLARR